MEGQRAIYKYDLPADSVNVIKMPEAEVLTVQVQGGSPKLWALVNPTAKPTANYFLTVGTGAQIPNEIKIQRYIGTFQLSAGALVFHVFQIAPVK